MKKPKYLAFAIAGILGSTVLFSATVPKIQAAQVAVQIGLPPVCPYGYYDYAPYACAPYGYYGQEWFVNGVFIGVGPWFHGPVHFRGPVNNHFDVNHGYKGPMPHVGDRPEAGKVPGKGFHGNERRDGHGHLVK